MLRSFPHYQQLTYGLCPAACMIAKFYGHVYSIQNLREKAFITREGVSMLGISEAAEAIRFRTARACGSWWRNWKRMSSPATALEPMAFWVVWHKIRKGKFPHSGPAAGLITYTREEFAGAGSVLRWIYRIMIWCSC